MSKLYLKEIRPNGLGPTRPIIDGPSRVRTMVNLAGRFLMTNSTKLAIPKTTKLQTLQMLMEESIGKTIISVSSC